MNLRFWGVRGSIPTPEPDRLRYGGNTTCLEIGCPSEKEAVIIDCGSGIRALGEELVRRQVSRIHILLSHFHWDHLQGLPSFAPLFQPGVEITFYATRPADQVRRLLEFQMAPPFFPVPFAEVGSNTSNVVKRSRQVQSGRRPLLFTIRRERWGFEWKQTGRHWCTPPIMSGVMRRSMRG
jgi:phosphoribosyl 1,2-cyclic phosphodiesterase